MNKLTYVDNVTVIPASNLNAIQDAINANETAITQKADQSTTYTKTEVDTALSQKANTSDVNTALGLKADKSDTYTKTEVDEAITEVQTEVEQDYAKTDGYYSEMTVGDAEQLVATQYVEDSEPYLFRTTGGSADVGNREYLDEIVGGSVGWNQLINEIHATQTKNGVTATKNADGSVTLSGTATALTALEMNAYLLQYKENHVYVAPNGTNFQCYDGYGADGYNLFKYGRTSTTGYMYARVENGVTVNEKFYPQLIDLTALFGSTIADYIYQLERNTAGAGVAFFKKLFPNDYYPYDAGSIKSVEGVSAHKMVGFNQWDEEWEVGTYDWSTGVKITAQNLIRSKNLIRVIPNTTYYFKSENNYNIFAFDGNEQFIALTYKIKNTEFTTDSATRFIAFSVQDTTAYNHDICINLSWSGYRNGEYEPYQKHSYALDDSLTLRGIPKLDSSNNLYYDGDIYKSDGTVTRNTILRAYQSGDESLANAITDGTNTVVYSANVSTESATPYSNVQICDDFGTEEFVSTSIVPVGHNTRYPDNLRDKLQHLPSLAGADGYYMISQQNNSMSLELFRIPKAPTEDGTYSLKATVSGGTPTYTWEAVE